MQANPSTARTPVPIHSEDRPILAIVLGLAGAASLATVAALAKLAHTAGVSLVEAMFYRQIFSLPIVLFCVQAGPGFASMRTKHFRLHVMRMFLGTSGMLLYFGAVMLLPLAEAMTIGFTAPIFATILSAVVLREPTGWHRWLAVFGGFAGVLLVLLPGLDANNLGWLGTTMGLAAALVTGCISILIRRMAKTEQPTSTVAWFVLLSIVPLACAMPLTAKSHDAGAFGLLALMGIGGAINQLTLTNALRFGSVSIIAPTDFTNLIWAILLGWIFWDDLPPSSTWVGAAVVVASGVYISYREHKLHLERTRAPLL